MTTKFSGRIGDGVSGNLILWNITPGLLIPPGLVEGGGTAYVRLIEGNSIGDFRFYTDTDPNRNPAQTFGGGTDLTAAWEQYEEAITFIAGSLEFFLPGPNYAGFSRRDASEGYSWSGPFSGPFRDRWNAFYAAYRALPQSDRNATMVELRDGPRGADVVINTAAQTVDSGDRVNLQATVTPLPGTTIDSYLWTGTGGEFVDPAIEDGVWVSPFQRLGSGEVPYVLTLTVTDSAGNVNSAEVEITVREVPVVDMAIGDSGKIEGIAVEGSGKLVGMAIGETVVYRQRVGRATMVTRSTSTGTRSTQVSSRNTVIRTRSTSRGSRSTSTGSRSTQATSRSTVTGSRNTNLAGRSTNLASRNTAYSSRNTSTGRRLTTPTRNTIPSRFTSLGTRVTNPTRTTRLQRTTATAGTGGEESHTTDTGQTRQTDAGGANRRTSRGSRNTNLTARSTASGPARNTSTGSRSTNLSRSTIPTRNTTPTRSTNISRQTSAASRNTSTGSRLTSRGSRQTNIIRSTEANARDTSTGSRNTTFTRITEA